MKRTIFLLTLLAAVTMAAKAYEVGDTFTVNGLMYEVKSETEVRLYRCESSTKPTTLEIPAVVNGFTVTEIFHNAFKDCSSLESVTIPSTVSVILTQVFGYCSNLREVNIPSSVTQIGLHAFYDCENLEVVNITDLSAWLNIDFGRDTWSNPLYNGAGLYLNGSLVTDLVVPDEIKVIKPYAFYGCSSLRSVYIHSGVTEIGYYAFYDCKNLEVVNITDLSAWFNVGFGSDVFNNALYKLYLNGNVVTDLVIPDDVTVIKPWMFSGCSSLKSVNMHSGVTEIGNSAFRDCTGLTSVKLSEGLTEIAAGVFYGCSGLTSVDIPDGVTSIGSSAFEGCSGLTSIYIPDGVTSIGSSAFSGCSRLKSVEIPNGVTKISERVFEDCSGLTSVDIPDGVTSIGSYAFSWCRGLTSVDIPDGVTSIGSYAFNVCSGLTSVDIPDGVTSIGSYAFNACSGLTSVDIPDGVTSIGSSAFERCSGLTSVDIPDGVTSIGSSAFSGCSGLTYVDIPSSVASIGGNAFIDCENLRDVYIEDLSAWCRIDFDSSFYSNYSSPLCYAEKLYLNGDLVTDLVIPDGIDVIQNGTFRGFVGFETLKIPSSVTEIEVKAFDGCTGLTSVEMQSGVTSIGQGAFSGCTGLTYVDIPSSVTSIDDDAFKDCENLKSVNIEDLSAWCKIRFEYALVEGDYDHYRSNPLHNGAGLYLNGELVTDLVIPDDIGYVYSAIFKGCSSIKSVIIPEKIPTIGSKAFKDCSNLTSIVLGDVKNISSDSFSGCPISEVILLGDSYGCMDKFPDISLNAVSYTFLAKEDAPEEIICKSLGLSTIPNHTYNGNGPSVAGIEITGNTSSYGIECVGVDSGERIETGLNCAKTADVRIYKKGAADGQAVEYHVNLPQKYYYLVNKAPLTVKAEPLAVEYGDPVTSDDFTLTYSGFIDGEDESVLAELPVANCEAGTLPDAGEHHIIVSGGDAKNYEFVYDNSGILTVVSAPLTGRIGNVEIEYGTEEIAFTDIVDYIEYSGFVNNDTEVEFMEAPELLTTWTPYAAPGEYPIVLNGGKAKNYDVTFVPGTLTVVPASQSIVWTQSFDYDVYEDMEIELDATATSGLPVSYSTDNPHIAEIFIENGKTMMRCTGVGTVTITATQKGNTYYEPAESLSKTITILPFGGAGTVDAGAVGCYPNPAVERLNVTGTADDSVIRIFDLNGRLLGTLKGEDGTTAVDVSGLAQGDYLLVVATGGKTATLRFTKK